MKKKLILFLLLATSIAIVLTLTSCSILGIGDNTDLGSAQGNQNQTNQTVVCKNHTFENSDSVAPGCTTMGYDVETCSVCGFFEYDFKPAVGHRFDTSLTISEQLSDGRTLKTHRCSICRESMLELVSPSFSTGLLYERLEEADEYRVAGMGTCTDNNVRVPATHEGLPVTEIGEKAFYNSSALVSVVLPNSIKKIYDKAFSDCESLQKVELPDDVELGLDVFRGSIEVILGYTHILNYVEEKAPTCTEVGTIAHYYCEHCDMYFADEKGEERIYDVSIPTAHSFVEGYCEICYVSYDMVNIVSIHQPTHLGKFALGTLENAIGLPEYVAAYTADGNEHLIYVQWDLTEYDKTTVGTYTIKGVLQTGLFVLSEELTNEVYVDIEIVDYMEGTADIVFILDISGSMSDEIASVKENLVWLAQAIESYGVSARWSVITYSDFTYSSDPNEMTTIIKNGTGEWYTSAAECETAISGISLAHGGDAPETAIDGLMMANTLTTRQDARTFYILLTDDEYKIDNNFDVESMEEAIAILDDRNVNVSAIISNEFDDCYTDLTSTTGGITVDIYSNFSQTLYDTLIPIIYENVVS